MTITFTKDEVARATIETLNEMTSDWDLGYSGGITAETRLIEDLGFESIDVVQLVGALEERFSKSGLPFEEILMDGGEYVEEIKVSELCAFLSRHLG